MEKKELIRVAMRGIRPMMERTISSGNAVDIARMVKVEKDNIISCCRGGYPAGSPRKVGDYIEVTMVAESLGPELEKLSRELEMKCRRDLTVRSIRETSAKAMVSQLLDEAGYHGYSFWCQRHRLKVVVRIGASTILIPILYSRINNLLEHIIPSLKEAEKMCSVFGKDFRIG